MSLSEDKRENPSETFDPINSECVIPPMLPRDVLPGLLTKRDHHAESAIREYVEWQTDGEKVQHAELVTTEYALGRRYDAWDVHTDLQRWWVVTSPTNLYSQELFPSVDYTISLHIGLTARVMSKPNPGVPEVEQALMTAAWRRWEQATESLNEAEEAEDFQAVGMRCRESLVAMVKEIANPDFVPKGDTSPKRSDFLGWSELISNHIARGESAEKVRGYLKSVSKSGWHLVNWLTHTSSATQADAALAIEATQHILGVFGTALFRHERGIPDQCASCGSYRIGLWVKDLDDAEPILRCQSCGAFCNPSISGAT